MSQQNGAPRRRRDLLVILIGKLLIACFVCLFDVIVTFFLLAVAMGIACGLVKFLLEFWP